jgi:ATP-binding cassette, subfamily B, multidrug efflux pump
MNMNNKKSDLWLLKPYMLKYKPLWIWGTLAVILSCAFSIVKPLILKSFLDTMKSGVTKSILWEYALIYVALTLVAGAFRFMMRQTLIVASRRIEYDFRNDFFDHLLRLDRPFYDKTPTGDIMARATNDMDAVRNMLGPGIMYFLNFCAMIFIFPIMFSISLKLTLISICFLPVITVLVFTLGKQIHIKTIAIQEKYSDITSMAQENFSGIRVVKAYRQEPHEINEFSKLGLDYIAKNMSMTKVWGMFFPAVGFFAGAALLLVIWFGGHDVINNKMTLGGFVAFINYLMMLIWPMAALGWVAGLYQRGKVSLTRIKEILDAQPIVVESPNPVNQEIKGGIELRGLRFAYDSREIIKGVDLQIAPGMNIAITGDTGCGKSTLINLLMRAYPVDRGMIFIDDIDINDYSLESIRRQIVPVMQDTFLFSETIESNIAYADFSHVPDEIRKAASIAGMSSEIEDFPDKYDTILGERGITLSGGQKQRTALARAIASKPKILILDDAFSSVDTQTEENILNNLRDVLAKCTTIMISHRISTIKNADLIIVLSDGRIIERGTHNELLEMNGHYAGLYEKQLLKEELEAL